MSDLHVRYAEEVAALSGARSPRLFHALSVVRREEFLPPGPWLIEALNGLYYPSGDADPRRVLHAVGVALDADRLLNNANPVRFAEQMELIEPQLGETVFHVGAGLGYYSAVLAELVGPTGKVLATEIDPGFRERAHGNLKAWPWVELTGDAMDVTVPPIDVLYSSAGLGTLPPSWLAALKPGGRMVVPITDKRNHGLVLLLRKTEEGHPWSAGLLSFTRHYPCHGTRGDADLNAVSAALGRPPALVTSLVFDQHEAGETCWLHGDGWCVSTRPLAQV